MFRGMIAAATLTATTLVASPATADRPVMPDGDILVTFGTVGCGANGKTVAHIELSATEGTQTAVLNIARTRSGGTRHVPVTDAAPVVAKVRVAAGRPVSVDVVDGSDVLAGLQFSGYPC